MRKQITAYTDGSAVVRGKSKGNGGFAAYFPDFYGKKLAFSLGFLNTKTGRMEVSALFYAITAFDLDQKEKVLLKVYSDSEYVVKTFTENRLQKWIRNDWRNPSGDIKNRDLWEAIILALKQRPFLDLEMEHIRSHQVEKAKTQEDKDVLLQNKHIQGNRVADFLADYKRHNELLTNDTLKK
jgi:ribonuclease HI